MDAIKMGRLLTEREVARALNLSVATLRRWRLQGKPPKWIKLGANIRYKPEEVLQFISACTRGGQV
jgi:predicted DNA-binding transcriptional regulator AlpA